jgi:serine phosphatase RsbU (regulator of sigma subunit)
MVKAVHWIWVVTSLWLTGYAHALAWDELTPFEVSASTPIIAAPSNNVSAQGVVTRYKASRCRLGYQSSIEDKDKPKVQTIAYQAGDTFAIVTDGLTDQVGGPDVIKKSYGYKRIEAILKTNCLRSAQEIANAIHADYALWQGTQSRRDDVTAVFFQL